MNRSALDTLLSGQNYLLLQGPMGPFFRDLGNWLESKGREVQQVVFNGGDWFYRRKEKSLPYQGTPEEFGAWLAATRSAWSFDTLVCFGDCRPLHQAARQWAQAQGIRFLVFEEGYLRPCFITLEENGVNGFSGLPREADFYRALSFLPVPDVRRIAPSLLRRIGHASWYYLMGCYFHRAFPLYQHHKCFSPWHEGVCWVRAALRKIGYCVAERGIRHLLSSEYRGRYFLAVLQVFNDSQLQHHSDYSDMRDFIEEAIGSFARGALPSQMLAIKHHPMDRGHRQYRSLIKTLSRRYSVSGRVVYVHDLPLPELLSNAAGVVTINSTVGISALIHNKPLKVMGRALYDMEGITFQGRLDAFWQASFRPDHTLFSTFRYYLMRKTQLNTVFYSSENPFSGL
ncbi:capsular biosynthesis protein [Cronobacter malonaticus]|uniref:capsule biosynthesis protein n=1 Tax=Cronobacter malonaticus TaxID=413503 RepID=UPI00029BDF40|nr:capsular biosynthesis protein [Cronobacter malonaticus]CCJ96663.1 Capsular polysaccharide export system protein KpsS [Cronobacter malonaticus 507]MBF4662134.1 capsular biosynthesis protein [Cronobacter malonaticus]MBF4837146.1 capsular biosynthesis protein [Cronobacter malonaticus]MBF4844762.1 capsular biosynthesis protein [Cronobacter malonaticus]MBF4848014.1 capsular biosynthesis protein [Cronobacter malonaticus]